MEKVTGKEYGIADFHLTATRWLAAPELAELDERDSDLLRRAVSVFEHNLFAAQDCAWGHYRGILPSPGQYNGVWNWDSAFHAMALSHIDAKLAYEQCEIFMDFQGDDGIFPDVIRTNRTKMDNYSKPPVFPWAFVRAYSNAPNPALLPRAYASYCRNAGFWEKCRRDEATGLFFYDATKINDNWPTHQKWESGMDTSPRWDDGVSRWLAVDLCGYMVLFYKALAQMAEWLQHPAEAAAWNRTAETLCANVRTLLWCDAKQCFLDRDRVTGTFSQVVTSASFVPLFAGCADRKQAAVMAKNARNPQLFYPSMPTVAFECETFSASDYWRGPVWLNYAYFAAEGLRLYGYAEQADALREYTLRTVDAEKRDIFEYYDAVSGRGLGASSFGWSAAFVIEWILEKYGIR